MFSWLKKYSTAQKVLIAILLVVILAQNAFVAATHSLVWDELYYIGEGKHLLNSPTGESQCFGNPPLSYYINSLFLYPIQLPEEIYANDNCLEFSDEFIFNSGFDHERLILLARLPFALLSIMLALYVVHATQHFFNRRASIVALVLYTFSTTVLSFSTITTLDFTLTVFYFITIYHFWRYLEKSSNKELILAGIATGLTITAKLTAIILFAILPVLYLIHQLQKRKKNTTFWSIIASSVKPFAILVACTFFTVWAVYGFDVNTIQDALPENYVQRAEVKIADTIPEGMQPTVTYIYEKIPIPFPNLFFSFGFHLSESKEGHSNFFLEPVNKVPWYVTAVAFFLKTQTPLFILLMISIFFVQYTKARIKDNSIYFVWTPILFLFGFLSFVSFASSISHILPVYPFIFLWVAGLWAHKPQKKNAKKYSLLIYFLLALYVVSSLVTFPHPMSYFTDFVGGADNGYKYLVSVNLDSGQSLPSLKEYLDQNNIAKVNFSYTGSQDPAYYGIEYDYMPTAHFQVWDPHYERYQFEYNVADDCSKRTGHIAISATSLQNTHLDNKTCFDWLKAYEPMAKIESAIFVYHITE